MISKLGSIEERGLTISRITKGLRIFKDNMRWKLQNNLPDMADVVGGQLGQAAQQCGHW